MVRQTSDIWRKLSRAFAFARHVPLSKLARRIELEGLRRFRQARTPPASFAAPAPRLSRSPPSPVFAPRHAEIVGDLKGWRFGFLHRTHQCGPRVDWRLGGEGGANQLWRMNLHYMEYLEAVDDTAFVDLVGQWIAANPPFAREYWRDAWNSYAVSLRSVVWMQQLALRRARLPPAVVDATVQSLAQHMRFLETHLETDIGGNHLIKNIKALLLASCFFDGAEAGRWRALGLRFLDREISGQVLADGVHYERSPSYHCQTFADLLECRVALGSDPLRGKLDGALQRMAVATARLTHPDGRVAQFNDAGLTMAYSPDDCLAVYGKIFPLAPLPQGAFAFRDAGYFGLQINQTYLLFDCGKIAPDDLPAHGHGDLLGFELSVAGQRIFVDPGVFEYIAGERRQRSRAASAHNTLCFDGEDQAEFFGAFRCGRRPAPALQSIEVSEDHLVVEATHDGFAHLSGRPRHVRRMAVRGDAVDIDDRIDAGAGQAATVGYLLHPEVVVEILPDGGFVLSRGEARIAFATSLPARVEPAVWWPDMGVELPTKRLLIALGGGIRSLQTSLRFS